VAIYSHPADLLTHYNSSPLAGDDCRGDVICGDVSRNRLGCELQADRGPPVATAAHLPVSSVGGDWRFNSCAAEPLRRRPHGWCYSARRRRVSFTEGAGSVGFPRPLRGRTGW